MTEFQFGNVNQPISPIAQQPEPKDSGTVGNKHGNKLLIATIILAVVVVIMTALAGWAFINYSNQKNDVDSRIANSVEDAIKVQKDKDELLFAAREKEPNLEFTGPEDYGGLSFSYPKTWSVYVGKDASSGGNYEAYLNPVSVPPVSVTQQYALRVLIQESDYDKIVDNYSALIQKGSLRSSSVTINNIKGTRLDGNFTKDIRGSAVIFKIRDKTLTVRTDAADTFKADFDKLIQTIKYNL